jgi:hypothetical protein
MSDFPKQKSSEYWEQISNIAVSKNLLKWCDIYDCFEIKGLVC